MRIININTLATNIFEDLLNNDILMFYYGEIDFDITNQIIKKLDRKLKEKCLDKKNYNKIYTAFAESLENAYKHQKRTNVKEEGFVLVSINQNNFYISVGNPIENSKRANIENEFAELKKKSTNELKELIKDRIANADIDKDESSNIGLIKIMLSTNKQVTAVFKSLEKNELLFIMQMKIDL